MGRRVISIPYFAPPVRLCDSRAWPHIVVDPMSGDLGRCALFPMWRMHLPGSSAEIPPTIANRPLYRFLLAHRLLPWPLGLQFWRDRDAETAPLLAKGPASSLSSGATPAVARAYRLAQVRKAFKPTRKGRALRNSSAMSKRRDSPKSTTLSPPPSGLGI